MVANSWAPVFSIPELLSLIFAHCLPPNGYTQPDSAAAPVVLALVCRKWRDLAYATPQLWSSIDMARGRHFCHPTDAIADKQLLVFSRWLPRTGSVPLRLHMSYGGGEDALEGRILAPVLDVSSRWFQLDITACFESIQSVLQRMSESAPLLEEATLSSTSHRRDGDTASDQLRLELKHARKLERFICSGNHKLILDAKDIPPSLKVLKIAYSIVAIPPHPEDVTSTSVEHLSLVHVSCTDPVRLLDMLGSSFQNVEELKLEIVGTAGTLNTISQFRNGRTVRLASLRMLHYKANFYDSDMVDEDGTSPFMATTLEAAFLTRLLLPALTDLTFAVFTQDTLESLVHLLRRSCPPLTRLKLLGFIPVAFDVREFLSELPLLTHLHIGNATHNEDVTKNVLSALTVRSTETPPQSVHARLNLDDEASPEPSLQPLCPRLTHFEFSVWTSRITPNYVTDMIISRCKNKATRTVVPLRRFALTLLPSNAQAVHSHPDIIDCVKNGLHLECYNR